MRSYLDHAATSWPKPPGVAAAMQSALEAGVALGRGHSPAGLAAAARVALGRRLAAQLLDVPAADRIIFTFNGTDSLNLVLFGLLRPGDHVVTTALEHNSVRRPLHALQQARQIGITVVDPRENGIIDSADIRAACTPRTRLVAVTHASNVTGAIQPVAEIAHVAHEQGALILVDAAQTVGHIPFSVRDAQLDLVACPGHKGCLGPLGTGLVYLAPGLEEHVQPFRFGGTGQHSESLSQPTILPERYEAGNHNVPGLLGLTAALEWITQQPAGAIVNHLHDLQERLISGLRALPRITVFGHHPGTTSVGVVSLRVDGWDPTDLANVLDADFSVQTRAGLHCSPGAHAWLGTLEQGGTLRLSLGATSTAADVDQAVDALRTIAQS